jgi:antitoxin component YwqK of YwqJK toxin-antitoxin module
MKHSLILILTLCFGINAFGQQPEYPDSGFTNKAEAKNLMVNGLKEGKWIEFYDGNPDKMTLTDNTNAPYYGLSIYEDNLKVGVERDYYKSGKLKAVYHFIDGKANGLNKLYFENGQLQAEYPFRNDTANGIQKEYYENGKLKSEYPVKDGKSNGDAIEYYENGAVMTKGTYTDAILISHKDYDENGNELKLSHFPRHTKSSKILNLIQGTWVYIEDTTLQINITKKELSISDYDAENIGDRFWGGQKGNYHYTLKYVDSTMKDDWWMGIDVDGWAGYCLVSKPTGMCFIQIYSISNNYMVIANDLIFKRKDVRPR